MATQSRDAPSVLGSKRCSHTARARMFFRSGGTKQKGKSNCEGHGIQINMLYVRTGQRNHAAITRVEFLMVWGAGQVIRQPADMAARMSVHRLACGAVLLFPCYVPTPSYHRCVSLIICVPLLDYPFTSGNEGASNPCSPSARPPDPLVPHSPLRAALHGKRNSLGRMPALHNALQPFT